MLCEWYDHFGRWACQASHLQRQSDAEWRGLLGIHQHRPRVDGSDSGASPEEAISWGKIRIDAKPVKVCADATIAFPLIVSQTFAKDLEGHKKRAEGTVCWLDHSDDQE